MFACLFARLVGLVGFCAYFFALLSIFMHWPRCQHNYLLYWQSSVPP